MGGVGTGGGVVAREGGLRGGDASREPSASLSDEPNELIKMCK